MNDEKDYVAPERTALQKVAIAMAVLAYYANLNGRRLARAYALSRTRWIRPEEGNLARRVAMAPRKLRRKLQGKQFRPVYGYTGPVVEQ